MEFRYTAKNFLYTGFINRARLQLPAPRKTSPSKLRSVPGVRVTGSEEAWVQFVGDGHGGVNDLGHHAMGLVLLLHRPLFGCPEELSRGSKWVRLSGRTRTHHLFGQQYEEGGRVDWGFSTKNGF